LATLLACALSLVKYEFEAWPRKAWRGEPAAPSIDVCPDGMDAQIELFADLLRGRPDAGQRLNYFLRTTHESSTYLVGAAGAPLAVLGLPAPRAFVVLSTLASFTLAWLVWRLLGELVSGRPDVRLLGYLAFLFHPATIRCFARPQTDALYALALFGALALG